MLLEVKDKSSNVSNIMSKGNTVNKGTSSKLSERGMDLQFFAHKKGSTNVGGSAIEGAAKAKIPRPTIDRNTGKEVGRFIGDEKGNIMIEPKGGDTVPGKDPVDTHTLYPNKSN